MPPPTGRVTRYARWRRAPEGEAADRAGDRSADRAGGGARWLPTDVAVDALTAAGLPIVPLRLAGDRGQALAAARELGYPVAVKSAARSRSAKTEVGGVALDVHDHDELGATLEGMGGAHGGVL